MSLFEQRLLDSLDALLALAHSSFLPRPARLPGPELPDHDAQDGEGQREEGELPSCCDVIAELDWSVGQILGTLRSEGLAQNTLVVFTSDNGPWLIRKQDGAFLYATTDLATIAYRVERHPLTILAGAAVGVEVGRSVGVAVGETIGVGVGVAPGGVAVGVGYVVTQQQQAAAPAPEKKAAPKKKAPAKKKAAAKKKPAKAAKKKAPAKGKKSATPTDQVLTIMKRFKKGISVEALRGKSGFSEKQISNIVHRACQKGKMKRIGRGIYSVVGL